MHACVKHPFCTAVPFTAACQQSVEKHTVCCRYPEGDLDTNLTIVITNVGADFTRLGSFGDAEQFGGQLVAQMDRSYLNRSWNKPKTPPQVATQAPHIALNSHLY